MADPVVMNRLHNDIARHLDAVEKLFTEPVKVSVMVRNPAHPDGSRDVYVTNDTPDETIAAIRQVLETGEATPAERP